MRSMRTCAVMYPTMFSEKHGRGLGGRRRNETTATFVRQDDRTIVGPAVKCTGVVVILLMLSEGRLAEVSVSIYDY